MKFGNEDLSDPKASESNKPMAIIDTGSSFIALPSSIYVNLVEALDTQLS